MRQVMEVIREMRGKIKIESKEGEVTEFILTFPKAEKPRWFVEKIEIKKGEEVVIVDDEELMHEVWKAKLKEYEKEIKIKFFTQGEEALKYLKSLENKEKVLFTYRLQVERTGSKRDRYNRGSRDERKAYTWNRRGSFKNKNLRF